MALYTKLLLGNCLKQMAQLDDNSIDSIVTDPPYGLSFMGKKWDYDVPSVDIWSECLRVLKPGGHLLAFAGTRTQHRMAVNIEDAGFEIRDMIAWVYGSGFPKSLNIGKAVDKMQGNERKVVETYVKKSGDFNGENGIGRGNYDDIELQKTKGNSEWEGWGTALKPALEPITVARKPIKGTVADNVLEWGTGGINIDDSRIQHDEPVKTTTRTEKGNVFNDKNSGLRNNPSNMASADPNGRFPANLIHDGSDEVVRMFPSEEDVSQSRFFYCAKASKSDRDEGLDAFGEQRTGGMQATADGSMLTGSGNERATKRRNIHPTVKPTDLMRYLVKLVTPPNGIVLDPFMGSGSTGKACVSEGFSFIGIEMQQEYMDIAKARIEREKKKGIQSDLF